LSFSISTTFSIITAQEEIMQSLSTTHQGLDRVIQIYSGLSRMVRAIARSLAVNQKAR